MPALPPTGRVTLGRSPNLSGPQFPHLQNVDNASVPGVVGVQREDTCTGSPQDSVGQVAGPQQKRLILQAKGCKPFGNMFLEKNYFYRWNPIWVPVIIYQV